MADQWLGHAQAAKALGISPDALKGRRRRGTVEASKGQDGLWLYRVPSDESAPQKEGADDDFWGAVKRLAGQVEQTVKEPIQTSSVYRIISLWDVHVPEADALAFQAVLNFIQDQQPDHIVLGGDFLELESCSQHGGNPNPRALVDEIQAGQHAIKRIRDAAPNAAITYLEGNHETRLNRIVVANIPEFSGALSVPALLHLADNNIEWVPYRQLWNPTINGTKANLSYTHGEWTSMHHAAKHLQMYGVSVRYGHTHRPQIHTRGFADGRVAMAIGSPCLRTLAPGWAGPHNGWLHGFGLDEFMPDGTFTAQNIVMANQRFCWGGKVYSA